MYFVSWVTSRYFWADLSLLINPNLLFELFWRWILSVLLRRTSMTSSSFLYPKLKKWLPCRFKINFLFSAFIFSSSRHNGFTYISIWHLATCLPSIIYHAFFNLSFTCHLCSHVISLNFLCALVFLCETWRQCPSCEWQSNPQSQCLRCCATMWKNILIYMVWKY